MLKRQGLVRRSLFAWAGVAHALGHESSFRIQLAAAVATLIAALLLRPPLVWMALLVIMIVLVLAAELFNTALEAVLDGLHPESAEFVRIAKDCAAGAVLVLSAGAVTVFGLMLWDVWGRPL